MKRWDAIGCAAAGAAHLSRGRPCQDALRLFFDPSGKFIVAAVADGHGSESCPYSLEGAEAAAEVAVELLAEILSGRDSFESFSFFDAQREIWIPKQLETIWKNKIKLIHAERERADIKPFPFIMYGTTLLTLAASEEFIFIMQIGDGDALLACEDGSEIMRLIEADENDSGDTFSLCMDDCWKYFQTALYPLETERDTMILLSTDGYSNCFPGGGFERACADIYESLCANGKEYVENNLREWLETSSANGSGDDITVALIFRGMLDFDF